MNNNEIVITVQVDGATVWEHATFYVHQKVQTVIDKGQKESKLSRNALYVISLEGRTLPLDVSFEEAGVKTGAVLSLEYFE
jgi:hypothetical protein